jgi:hypothetical protein
VAKYGFTLYGLKKYGQLDGSQLYYNSAISAMATNYKTIRVTWETIVPDPADPSPTHWKLIRTQFGAPEDPQRGTAILSGVISALPSQFTDNVPDALAGQEIYYSLWLFNGVDWIACGEAAAMAVPDTGTLLNITRRLPAAWLNDQQGIGDATGNAESSNQLVTFLSGLLFSYDYQRTQASLLEKIPDYRKIPTKLLETAVANVAMPYEPSLGSGTSRTLYRVGHLVNASKGSTSGIRQFVSALTHWGSSIALGRNLMLDYNDSSFEESLGGWTTTAGTLTRVLYTQTVGGTLIDVPSASQAYSLYPPRAVAFARLTSTGTAVMKLGHGGMPFSGIPVQPGTDYTFSGFFRQLTTNLAMTWTITWWGRNSSISSVTQSFTGTSKDAWVSYRFDAGTSPADAVYAEVAISFTGSTNDVLLDMLQFESTSKSIRFQDSRVVQVKIDADRTNFLANPAFDNGTGGWYGKNASIIQDSASSTHPIFGSSVARVDATGSAPAMISEWTPVTPGAPFTFSAYVKGSGTAKARIEFTSPQSAADQISILSDSHGSYFPTAMEIKDGDAVTLSSSFQRVSVTAQSPTYVADNGAAMAKVSIYFPSGTTGSSYYVDGCLLDQTTQPLSYFQGNGGPAPSNPLTEQLISLNDCRWEWREQTNLVNNPVFSTAAGWSGNSGTTVSAVTTGATPYAGNKMLKVLRSAAGTATVTSTVYLEQPVASGGEDITLSIRITGFTGQVSIGDGTTNQTFTIPSETAGNWSELWCPRVTAQGETSFTFTVSATMGSSGQFLLSAAQAEAGRTPGKFVDPSNTATSSRPNLSHPSTVVWDTYQAQDGAGRSYYWSKYYDKYHRLAGTLNQVMPLGSSWEIISGRSSELSADPASSMVLSPSFEHSLDHWTPDSATLARAVSRGSHFSEHAANGAAWCQATSTVSGSFGLHTDPIEVTSFSGYYLSAAIRPVGGAGTATLQVDWLSIEGDLLWSTTTTAEVTQTNRWTYIALTDKNIHDIGSSGTPDFVFGSYAVVRISFLADSPAVGNKFLVDRVLFRE